MRYILALVLSCFALSSSVGVAGTLKGDAPILYPVFGENSGWKKLDKCQAPSERDVSKKLCYDNASLNISLLVANDIEDSDPVRTVRALGVVDTLLDDEMGAKISIRRIRYTQHVLGSGQKVKVLVVNFSRGGKENTQLFFSTGRTMVHLLSYMSLDDTLVRGMLILLRFEPVKQ